MPISNEPRILSSMKMWPSASNAILSECYDRVALFDASAGISKILVAAPYTPSYSTGFVPAEKTRQEPEVLLVIWEVIPPFVLTAGLALTIYIVLRRRHDRPEKKGLKIWQMHRPRQFFEIQAEFCKAMYATRLQIIHVLRERPMSVGEIAGTTGFSQSLVSAN
ncbi:MAG: ArsR family transcriptional regulator [Sphingobacterium sp.]|nr:ArsR family transcriptional regulator [Sphingobacterium sp.]